MIELWSVWDRCFRRLRSARRPLILFDYDGVLAPIASTPDEAALKPSIRGLLRRLSRRRGMRVGILSGRALADLRRQVRVPGLIYGGSHGLEIRGPSLRFRAVLGPGRQGTLRRLARDLERALQPIPGALVEFKGLCLSLHRRRVPPDLRREFRMRWRTLVQPFLKQHEWRILTGKEVVEIRPAVRWDKCRALRWLKTTKPLPDLVLFAGDDRTDEDAFLALAPGDIGVRVGRSRRSAARYWVRSPKDIETLLQRLDAL